MHVCLPSGRPSILTSSSAICIDDADIAQQGFFQSLFTAGFSESRIKPGGHRLEPDVIDIVLEDPNITRAGAHAFSLYHRLPPLTMVVY